MLNKEEIIKKLEEDGLEAVEKKLSEGAYAPEKKIDLVTNWVNDQKKAAIKKENAPTYMYHPINAPEGQIFKANEVQELERNGWFDSPSKFPEKNETLTLLKAFWLKHWKFLVSTLIAIVAIYFGYVK